MSRIIFLDFDGVLNSGPFLSADHGAGWEAAGEAAAIDPAAVARLNRIVEATGAEVVVSSSWRHGRMRTELSGLLKSRGFKGIVRDKTPDFVPNGDDLSNRHCGERGDEIRAWLDANGPRLGVTSFVVLDDNSDMSAVRDRFVQTDFDAGLTDAHVDRCIAMLKGGGAA